MLESLTAHYGWWLFALILIGAELVMPGYFMLWIGIAAAAVGVLLLALPGLSFFGQTVAFVVAIHRRQPAPDRRDGDTARAESAPSPRSWTWSSGRGRTHKTSGGHCLPSCERELTCRGFT